MNQANQTLCSVARKATLRKIALPNMRIPDSSDDEGAPNQAPAYLGVRRYKKRKCDHQMEIGYRATASFSQRSNKVASSSDEDADEAPVASRLTRRYKKQQKSEVKDKSAVATMASRRNGQSKTSSKCRLSVSASSKSEKNCGGKKSSFPLPIGEVELDESGRTKCTVLHCNWSNTYKDLHQATKGVRAHINTMHRVYCDQAILTTQEKMIVNSIVQYFKAEKPFTRTACLELLMPTQKCSDAVLSTGASEPAFSMDISNDSGVVTVPESTRASDESWMIISSSDSEDEDNLEAAPAPTQAEHVSDESDFSRVSPSSLPRSDTDSSSDLDLESDEEKDIYARVREKFL